MTKGLTRDTNAPMDLDKRLEKKIRHRARNPESRNRSLLEEIAFFLGFIASAFIGYATLHSDIRIVIACFGMVCSFAWSLLNRGSKYWQENWEQKVEKLEAALFPPPKTFTLFPHQEPCEDKGLWLSARKYSVSKLVIALSDYVFLLWFGIVVYEMCHRYLPASSYSRLKEISLITFVACSLVSSVSC